MFKFKKGDLVADNRGRVGTILRVYKNVMGTFYEIIFQEEILSLPEEEISLKDG